MNKELDDKLVSEFPALYGERKMDPKETCMCWGFPDDGWYDIIYELSSFITNILKNYPGYNVVAEQVKEKYGTLRFYYRLEVPDGTGKTDSIILESEIEGAAAMAERMSAHTCEICGNKGRTNNAGWLITLCEVCRDRFMEK